MSDLFDTADSRRGGGTLSTQGPPSTADLAAYTPPEQTREADVEHVAPVPRAHPVLRCQRVSKWYGPVIGVNQVSLELRSGITGLVGSNGAGKTTLMRLITGQLKPDIGRVQVHDRDAFSAAGKLHVGYCPDADVFYEEMSGREFLETMGQLCGYTSRESRRRTEATLELVGMAGRADRCVRGYSKGMRQRIKLAQALLHDPGLLVLDEPLSGIDPVGRAEMLALFKRLAAMGKTLLISSHELEELEKLTDHIIIMARGRIAVVGTVAQIRDRLDQHPLTIRIALKAPEGADPETFCRDMGAALLRLPGVVGVEIEEADLWEEADTVSLCIQARRPQQLFADFQRLVVEEGYQVRRLETLDSSTQAVLGYLLGGRG